MTLGVGLLGLLTSTISYGVLVVFMLLQVRVSLASKYLGMKE